MREIKFRGKVRKEGVPILGPYPIGDGEWIYGDLHIRCKYPHIHYGPGLKVPIDLDTIGQYTGLKDKNGKEIYEGDIVASTSGEFIYEVVYDDKRFASFCLCRKQDMFKHYFGEAMEAEECKVIGNIHDNPELIEK